MNDTATDGVDLVALADTVYDGVAADPAVFGQQAADLVGRARREGPVEALVVALRAQAWAERLALRNASARGLLNEAITLAQRHRLDRRLGEVLVSRVVVHQELGDLGAAQRDIDRAIGLLPSGQRAELVFVQGALLQNRGRLGEAGVQYRLVLADAGCSPLVRAKAGNNLAHLESELGHSEDARALLDEARPVAELAGATVRAYVAQTSAWIEMHAGRLPESLARFEEAQGLFAAAGMALGEPLAEYTDALAGLRLLPEALEAAERACAALPPAEASLMAAEAQLRVARLSFLIGEPETARLHAEECAGLLRRQGRRGWLARAESVRLGIAAADGRLTPAQLRRLRLVATELEDSGMRTDAVDAHLLAGRLSLSAGQLLAAGASLRSVTRLSSKSPVLVRMRGHVAAALLADADGSGRAVVAACQAGLLDLDRHRRALPTMELRMLASAHGAELGSMGLRALRATGTPARVFQWLERTRAAALVPLEALAADGVQAEMAELRALHGEVSDARASGESDPAGLLTKLAAAEAAVRRASWQAAPDAPASASALSPPPRAGEVRERLADATLVEYGEVDGALLAVVLDRRGTRLVDLGPVAGLSATIDAALFGLRRLARPGGSAAALRGATLATRAALASLTSQLVAPLGIAAGAPLVVVPVGDLQRIPWAPLRGGPTTVVPSAALWLRTTRPGSPSGATPPARLPHVGRRVAVIVGPDLEGALDEAARVADHHPHSTVLAPPESSCSAVAALLQEVDAAHFACHGRLRTDNPSFSALLLSDGPLTVHELTRRGGAPATVVLAACESGAQVGFAGGEALGFVSALLACGSTGVIASSVLVSDEGTSQLMLAVHERLAAGATVADALWSARRGLDTEDPHQFASWCAFDAYGGG